MREYSLQDPEYRKTVDLRNYKKIIEDSVHEIAPSAVVTVYRDRYTLSPDLPKGDLIKIGISLVLFRKLLLTILLC